MIDVLSALLTPVIALFAVYIAYQQFRINREKLKLNLYNKRLEIFHKTWSYLSLIMRDADVHTENLLKFNSDCVEVEFLFGKDISDYIQELYKKGVDLQYTNQRMKPNSGINDDLRRKIIDQNSELLKYFGHEIANLREKFKPYLDFSKI